MPNPKEASLPRPCPVISPSDFLDDKEGASSAGGGSSEALPEKQMPPGFLPAYIRVDESHPAPGPDDPVITPWEDFIHFSQVPDVPRKLADAQEFRSQPWPLPAPEEMTSDAMQLMSIRAPHVPAVFFAKRHRFTIFNYSDLLQSDRSCESSPMKEDDEMVRFTELSNKVDYCIRLKNSYKFQNVILQDAVGAFKDSKPKICAACSVKTKACLLTDLRHKYRFTFFHTIHVYSPAGFEVQSEISLYDKSNIEALSTMKICPSPSASGRKMEKLKPEIVTLLQVTHFVRVSSSVMPDNSASMMPRPLPPEFREPQFMIIDEDLYDRAPFSKKNQPAEPEASPSGASQAPAPAAPAPPKRPSRSEPPEATE